MPEPSSRPELLLFGLPRVLLDGEPVRVGTRKALLMLAMLALEGPQLRETLAAALWRDLDLASARRNLRREVFRLRRLGCPLVERRAQALALGPAWAVDVGRFRAAIAAGDDELALKLAASRVCDGLDTVAAPETAAQLAAWREQLLHERRLARERLALRLERQGASGAALALHLQALAEDGCAEAHACHAMRLQVAAGQRAAAALLYQRLQATLRDELGVGCAATTSALAAGLGLGEGPAAAPAPVSAPPPASPAWLPERLPFVGRSRERAAIDAAWAAGRPVYLSGLPGSGKTRLAAECAAGRGAWLRVACLPGDASLPYAFAVRMLRALRGAAPDVELPAWVQRELAPLLPELGARVQPARFGSGERVQAAFGAAWRLLLHENFNTIVFDDWQWCDRASSELGLNVDGADCAWLLVFRTAQLAPPALQRMRREVDAGAAAAVALEGLSAAETGELLRALDGAVPDPDFAARLHRSTEGNPFFVIETVRHLAQQAQPGPAAAPPATVRDVVLGRVRALGEPARRLLEAASLAGDGFGAPVLEGATALRAEEVVAVLEHAQAAQLVVAAGAGYRFAHDLVRQCLEASLSPARRRLLHERLARCLEANEGEPAAIAEHWEGAGRAAVAVPWRQRAAEAAWRVHALAETLQHGQAALADGAAGGAAVAVQLLLAQAYRRLGDARASGEACDAAVLAAQALDSCTRIEAKLAQLAHWTFGGRKAEAVAQLENLGGALDGVPAPLRARVLVALSDAMRLDARFDDARVVEDLAIAMLQGEPNVLPERARLLEGAARTALRGGRDLVRAQTLIRQAVACLEALGDEERLASALVLQGLVALHLDNDRAAARAGFERARTLAARCGHVPFERQAILNLIKLDTDAGRIDAALALVDAGEALAPGFEHANAEQAFREARYFLYYLRGDVAAARSAAEEVLQAAGRLEDIGMRLGARQLVADLYLHSGDLAGAARVLEHAAGAPPPRSAALVAFEAKRAWLELARGDADRARRQIDALGEPELADDLPLLAWVGAAAALAAGDPHDAERRLQRAPIAAEHPGDLLAMLLVQRLRLARALRRDDAAARARARELLALGSVPALEAGLLRAELDGGAANQR